MHQSTGDRRPGNEANANLNWKRMLVGWKGSGLNKAYTVYIHLINVPFSWGCQVFFIIIIGRSCFFFPMFSGKICSFCFCCLICVCVCMSSDFGRSVGAGGYDINHAVVKDVFASLYERDFHHGKSWKKKRPKQHPKAIWVFPSMVVPPFHPKCWSFLVEKPMVVW